MREAIGQLFVSKYPDADSIRARAQGVITEIEKQFDQDLSALDWLDDSTRTAARAKLAKVASKVGYPSKWDSYGALEVGSDSYLALKFSAASFAFLEDMSKIDQPTDRTHWDMGVWVANAYYDPPGNSMNFPLGALLPPVFDVAASDGLNYGSFGASWVGHELTHGFDSGGRKYDGDGNLRDWWSTDAATRFQQRVQCLVDQASRYEVLPGLFVNGAATITENLADQGGMKIGYLAYRELSASRAPAAPIAGMNEDQQFYVAYAQGWCAKRTEQSLRRVVQTDPHPPEEFRVNGVIMNQPGFEKAFSCRSGDRMAPVNRCAVW
jgi:endothelin-converting enzyme/putative endopeptidase